MNTIHGLPIDFISDVHTEYERPSVIKNLIQDIQMSSGNEYCILAGDIGHIHSALWEDLIVVISTKYKTILYILGNHEYYKLNYDDVCELYQHKIENVLKKKELNMNYIMLENQYYISSTFVVCGATFWTQFKSPDIFRYIKDYKVISNGGKTMSYFINDKYTETKKWIIDNINTLKEKYPDKKIIVVTHFPPKQKGTSSPKYNQQQKIIRDYFTHPWCNQFNNVDIWISGHTHYPYNFTYKGIHMTSNPFQKD